MLETEVLIVGGGPAGSACAWRLRQLGIPCLILDKAEFPRLKPCAGWITPAVFKLLNIRPEDYPCGLTQFGSFQISLRGLNFTLPTCQFAIRRTAFDHWLLEQSGVEWVLHTVNKIQQTNNRYLVDGQFAGKYLVGAGGTHCPVRRKYFPRAGIQGLILTKEEEFPYPYKDDRCHLWFFERGLPGYAWYVPKVDGFLNIGIGGSAARIKAQGTTLNNYWDQFVQKLDREGLVSNHAFKPLGHSYFLNSQSRQVRLGNAFLIGDALGLATRDMGEGIGPAIHSGVIVAESISGQCSVNLAPIPRFSLPAIIRRRGYPA